MIKPIAPTFALAVAFAPVAVFAQDTGMGTPPPAEAAGVPVWTAPGAAPATRQMVSQTPHGNAKPPLLSRDPGDCVKTICAVSNGG